jgi:hypothetical protein
MKTIFVIICQICLVITFAQTNKQSNDYETYIKDLSVRGIIYKQVLLFNDTKIQFDATQPVEIPYLEYKLSTPTSISSLEVLKKRANNIDSDNSAYIKVDPMTGEPINYSVARLQSYYYAWRDFLVKKKDVISYFDSTNYSAILLKENIANTKVYILLNIQFKPNKLQIICENHGVVRTVENPHQTAFTFGELFENEKSLSIEQKKSAIDAYTNSLKKLPVDLMDFILDDKDFVNRAESDLLQFTPSFNF